MDSKQRARERRLLDCFGLTIEQWEQINEYQQGLCYFCRKPQKSGKRLATDHRHLDGLCRGVLDSQCNRLLGRIESLGWSVETLKRVIEYLEDPPAVRALGKQVFGWPGRINTKKHRAAIKKARKLKEK